VKFMERDYEALAILRRIKNTRKGIEIRSKIIRTLRHRLATISELSKLVNRSYSTIRYHVKNMEKEGIVMRFNNKWRLTGKGQQSMEAFLLK